MPIALGRNSTSDHRVRRSVFVYKMACTPVCNSSDKFAGGRQRSEENSSSTSSIGKNSDDSLSASGGESEEVQSEFKGGPLDSMEALEVVLPIKRGLSKFYSGKSKSFTSLGIAASCFSIEEITKPENALTRKRKNLLAHNNSWDKNYGNNLTTDSGGIAKRPANSRSSLALSAATGFSESNSSISESSTSSSLSPVLGRPPLPPRLRRTPHSELSALPQSQNVSPSRSLSLSDLKGASAATPSITDFSCNIEENSSDLHCHSRH